MSAMVQQLEVERYVAAVRAALDDLAAEEVEELTGGLEADLDDALADAPARHPAADPDADPASDPGADHDSGVARFGSPADYAAELRAAAGLPPRAARGGRRGAGSLAGRIEAVQSSWQQRLDRLRARRWWATASDFLVTLRPVWWVARGWAAYQFLGAVLGRGEARVLPVTLSGLILLGLLVVLSVEVGRRWAASASRPPHGSAGRLRRWVLGVANTVAVLLFLAFGSAVQVVQYLPSPGVQEVAVPPDNGLWLNGTEVRNVFPYDANGRPLSDVQLFDENGRSLSVGTSAQTPLTEQTGPYAGQRAIRQVPAVDANNRPVWNVYPLRQQEVESGAYTDPNTGQPADRPVSSPTAAAAPMQTLLPVAPPLAASSTPPGAPTGSGSSTLQPSAANGSATPQVSAAPTTPPAGQASTAPTGSPRP